MTTETRKPGIYLDIKDLDLATQVQYLLGLAIGIAGTYTLLGKYLVPLVVSGAVSMSVFYGATILVAIVWVGIIKLINKYWLQQRLIEKGILC